MIKEYLDDIFNTAKAGDVREESYYPALKSLLETYAALQSKSFFVTSLPKKTEAGNPDFRVLTAKKQLVGYIEAKDPKVENLDAVESSEQLKRYLNTFPNVILTNFFEFRLYKNGELTDKVSVGRPFVAHTLKMVPPVENEDKFVALLEKFFASVTPRTTTPKQLAVELAKRTRFLRDQVVAEELKEEQFEGTQNMEAFYESFKKRLVGSLTTSDFSNLFSQTITYGLFAACIDAKGQFTRESAHKHIPPTIGILKEMFRFVSLSAELPKQMEWVIDDIVEVLAACDLEKIISSFYEDGKGRDPIIHFYETFLAAYDPKERSKRGVYYTPEPVVGFITRSIHQLLKEKFCKADGFADSSVTVLDPAAGTLTFPVAAMRLAIDEYRDKYGGGNIHDLIKGHLLRDFYAFELMMAPYAVGHLKIGLVLKELGYTLADSERFKLYLTNTLDFSKDEGETVSYFYEKTLAEEAKQALAVKEQERVMVIMGNPPYSGNSENKGEWILEKLTDYKQVDGKPLGERNPKWLQDDYVKFIRFAQYKIDQNGSGILGFITNHAWLDNPTFRGMRASLLKTFDEIYIVDLHGSTLKKEKTPTGGKDENVFDIKAGVAILLAVKKTNKTRSVVKHAEFWGLREEKQAQLDASKDLTSLPFKEFASISPYYFFVPKNDEGWNQYQDFKSVNDIFLVSSVGVVTARDNFVIDEFKKELEVRIRIFRDLQNTNEFIKSVYGLEDKPTFHWSLSEARKELSSLTNWENNFRKILYRPFDERWIYYHPAVVERTREEVMQHTLRPNLALVACRQLSADGFQHAFIANGLVESCYVSNKTKEIGYAFPLWQYVAEPQQQVLLGGQERLDLEGTQHTLRTSENKKSNFKEEFLAYINNLYKQQSVSPEDIFYYIYAVLYSDTYRKKYAEFLKIDFPRVPFTKDYTLFKKLAELGERLVNLHLLKFAELSKLLVKFNGAGNGLVEKREYNELEQRVYINGSQHFDSVTSEMWRYYIGGYQVLDKWLKDRKGRHLSSEDSVHYCQMATATAETIKVQWDIDKLFTKL